MKPRLALIGPGRVGQSVGRLLREAGYPLVAVIGRDLQRTRAAARFMGLPDEAASLDPIRGREAEVLMLAVPDDALKEAARSLRGVVSPGAVLIHFSGRAPAALLQEGDPPPPALSLHPLQTFADPETGLARLPGSYVAVEGSASALPVGESLARDLGGIPFRLPADQKPLYHAAASVASNFTVTLAAAARDLMAACGMEPRLAFERLTPLLRGTWENLFALGPEGALTGPVARGDVGTVQAHLTVLRDRPRENELYRVMARNTVEIAKRKGTLGAEEGEKILALLKEEGEDG